MIKLWEAFRVSDWCPDWVIWEHPCRCLLCCHCWGDLYIAVGLSDRHPPPKIQASSWSGMFHPEPCLGCYCPSNSVHSHVLLSLVRPPPPKKCFRWRIPPPKKVGYIGALVTVSSNYFFANRLGWTNVTDCRKWSIVCLECAYQGHWYLSEPQVPITATGTYHGHWYLSGPLVPVRATGTCQGHWYLSGPLVPVRATGSRIIQ